MNDAVTGEEAGPLTAYQPVSVDPLDQFDFTPLWVQVWRSSDDELCEQTTTLSGTEHRYVTTRWRMDPAWINQGVHDESFELWCPLKRHHEGAHVARLGWADLQWQVDDDPIEAGTWFIEWGPHASDPRLIGPKGQVPGSGVSPVILRRG